MRNIDKKSPNLIEWLERKLTIFLKNILIRLFCIFDLLQNQEIQYFVKTQWLIDSIFLVESKNS